jgi:hypothetical protein
MTAADEREIEQCLRRLKPERLDALINDQIGDTLQFSPNVECASTFPGISMLPVTPRPFSRCNTACRLVGKNGQLRRGRTVNSLERKRLHR